MAEEQKAEERDESEVTVELAEQRAYYPTGVEETNENVVMVGPGEVQVPAWVAKEWKIAPKGSKGAPTAPAVPRKKANGGTA